MNTDPIAATRPRNRRQLIVEAAGRVFSKRGYHAASMEEIATDVGISAAALYRHFPNKYALFAECAHVNADQLLAAVDELPPGAGLERVLGGVARAAVAHRASGGLYRWEARYLVREDRRLLGVKLGRVVGRVTEAVREEYAVPDPELHAAAALGAIGSITMHHVSLTQRRLEEVLVASALRVCTSDPARTVEGPRRTELPVRPVPRTRRAEILAAAIPLFARDGFVKVTNGQIAEAVGLAPSALYRHYPTKVDILVAACLQAAALLSQTVDQGLGEVTDPHDAVLSLAAAYVAYSFEHTELTSVAEAEIRGLPADVQQPLILAQREHVDLWEQQLRAARPELDPRQARVLVHAGFGVVVEAGRRLHWQDSVEHRDTVTALVVAALGV
ncbi:TetR/AcrR family transcriptional regulator [Streptomyces mangrovisoli]|uniref:TetR family transcriptional regulator n=1 Tax=Streptomyces mangrovisoli TaxID=1428628 RepID=A0A1J4NU50_9ACTN|nr:TetR/AcrR family transcriptional regulator [Streptomyces mangrovisoli]OIJ66009.1 TetR family transcriptional regulator [Streptomyces mangrovisoli]